MVELTGRDEAAERTPTEALHVLVEGRVQGVGFRAFVRARAQALGVAGWVRNTPDGAVEVAAVGPREAVADLRHTLLIGPARATVTAVRDLPPVPVQVIDRFEVVKIAPVEDAARRPWWRRW